MSDALAIALEMAATAADAGPDGLSKAQRARLLALAGMAGDLGGPPAGDGLGDPSGESARRVKAHMDGWLRARVGGGLPPASFADALFADLSPADLDAEGGCAAFARAASQRKVGEVWQGPSQRWFTRRESDGRTVPAKGPGGAQAAPAEAGKPAPARAGRPTVEALAAELKRLNKADLTPEKVKHYADTLAGMTVKDLLALKAALGWGGRGGIAERTKKGGLVGRMLARATQEETDKGAKAGKPAPAPAAPAAPPGKAGEALAKVKALDETIHDPTRSTDDIRAEVGAAMKGLDAKGVQAVLDGFDVSRRFPSAAKAADAVAQKLIDRKGAFDRTKINRGTKTVDAADPSNVRPPEPDYRALGTAEGRHDARLAHEKALDEWERRRAKNAEAALRKPTKAGKAPPAGPMAGHPFAGKSRGEMIAFLGAKATAAGGNKDLNPFGLKAQDPHGLVPEVVGAVRAAQAKNSFLRPDIGTLYRGAQERHPGLSLRDFQQALVAGLEGKQLRLDPYTQALSALPDERLRHVLPLDMEPKLFVDLGPKAGAVAPPAAPAAALASAFLAHPGAKANLVSLADLKDATGMSTEQLHAEVQRLRKAGVLSGSAHESRTPDPRTREASLPPDAPGEHPMGYVAVRAGQEARLRALARGKGGAS